MPDPFGTFAAVAFLSLLGFHPSPAGAAINTDIALTPAKGQTILRTQYTRTEKGDDPTSENRSLTVHRIKQVAVYGLTPATAGFLVVPYLEKSLSTAASGQRVQRSDSGLGDLKAFLKHRVFRGDFPGGTQRVSILGGLKFPTGEHHESDGIGRLPASLRLGSGSWDPFFGAVFTRQTQTYEISQDVTVQLNAGHDDLHFGDVIRHNTGGWLRIWPRELPEWKPPKAVHAVLELNGVWKGKNASGGTVQNSGGYELFLSPGIQYLTHRFILEASVQIPVAQDLNGDQLSTDWAVSAGGRVTF